MVDRRRTGKTATALRVVVASLGAVCLPASASAGPCPSTAITYHLASPQARDGILRVELYTGETAELDVFAQIRTSSPDPSAWIQSFTLSVSHDSDVLTLLAAELNDDDVPAVGIGGPNGTNVVDNETGSGFVSYHAGLCAGSSACWLPPTSDSPVVQARYRVIAPPRGQEPVSPPTALETRIEFRDGLRGAGQPVANACTVQGGTVLPCVESLELEVEVVESRDFVRGDANHDRRIDVSDAVTLLRSKFFGDVAVHCADAGDANDDGILDISDAISLFGYLFLGGTAPPSPFPDRGRDPTPDDLRCRPPASVLVEP